MLSLRSATASTRLQGVGVFRGKLDCGSRNGRRRKARPQGRQGGTNIVVLVDQAR